MAKFPGRRSFPHPMPVRNQDHTAIVDLEILSRERNNRDLVLQLLLCPGNVVGEDDFDGEVLVVGHGGPQAALGSLCELVDYDIALTALVDRLNRALFDVVAPVKTLVQLWGSS